MTFVFETTARKTLNKQGVYSRPALMNLRLSSLENTHHNISIDKSRKYIVDQKL